MDNITQLYNNVTPQDTAAALFQAAEKLDGQRMAQLILPTNEANKARIEELMNELNSDPNVAAYLDGAGNLSFEIEESEQNGEEVRIKGTCTYLDASEALSEGLNKKLEEMLVKALRGIKHIPEELNELYSESLMKAPSTDQEILKTAPIALDLTRYNGTWFVKEVNEELQDIFTLGINKVTRSWETLKDPAVLREALSRLEQEEKGKN